MKLSSDSFKDMAVIPGRCAFAVPDAKNHIALSQNRNPHLAWSGLPEGTRSLALVCHDHDVPSKADDVNKEGREIPSALPRVEFFHWVLVDLKPDSGAIAEGEFSNGITPHGKPGPAAPRGARHGINDYTSWFANDKDMAGDYFGYDGPCPPWNDSIPHHYVFTLYALGIEQLPLHGRFGGQDAIMAMKGHVLAAAKLIGMYSLNPAVPV